MNKLTVLLGIVVLFAMVAVAQTDKTASLPKGEISFNYVNTRADFAPSEAPAFHLQGMSMDGVINLYHGLGLAGELAGEHAGQISSAGESLSLFSYMAGPRYSHPVGDRFTPYVQGLFGRVHGFDSMFPEAGGTAPSANAFAMALGGGLEVRLPHHLSLKALQADYFKTDLPNDYANHQNNFRLTTGIVFRFGK